MGISQDKCFYCGKEGFKTNSNSQVICQKCAIANSVPEKGLSHYPRNGSCHCGSNKKYKHCHYYQDKFPPLEVADAS